jgi:hypothetical protein
MESRRYLCRIFHPPQIIQPRRRFRRRRPRFPDSLPNALHDTLLPHRILQYPMVQKHLIPLWTRRDRSHMEHIQNARHTHRRNLAGTYPSSLDCSTHGCSGQPCQSPPLTANALDIQGFTSCVLSGDIQRCRSHRSIPSPSESPSRGHR